MTQRVIEVPSEDNRSDCRKCPILDPAIAHCDVLDEYVLDNGPWAQHHPDCPLLNGGTVLVKAKETK